jgi:hypothetical protein
VPGLNCASERTITSVTGDTVEALVIYRDTGVAATSPLILYLDTATGFTLTPDGNNVNIVWSNGGSKIFAL